MVLIKSGLGWGGVGGEGVSQKPKTQGKIKKKRHTPNKNKTQPNCNQGSYDIPLFVELLHYGLKGDFNTQIATDWLRGAEFGFFLFLSVDICVVVAFSTLIYLYPFLKKKQCKIIKIL